MTRTMGRGILIGVLICSAIAFAGQSGPQKYQSATVLDAKEHQGPIPENAGDSSITRYDITIRVKDTEYVVLYTPRPGTHGFQYMNGTTMLVLVKDNTVTFNDILGRSMTAPILSQKPAAPRNKP